MKTPITVAPEDLDFGRLIQEGDTVGWAQATAEPVFLTRILNQQAARCPPFRLFFALGFGTDFAADHPNVTVTAFGGGGAGRRFFAAGAGNVIPANISAMCGLISLPPSEQFTPTISGLAWRTEFQNASTVWPDRVRPLMSTIVTLWPST